MSRIVTMFFLFLLFVSQAGASESIHWYYDVDAAVEESERTGKPIFVDVYTEWCGWCTKLDEEVYTEPDFIRYMDNFVALKVNAEDGGIGTRMAEYFEVKGYPTLLILDSEGEVIHSVVGYMESAELIDEISLAL